jgi:hypothetical protein
MSVEMSDVVPFHQQAEFALPTPYGKTRMRRLTNLQYLAIKFTDGLKKMLMGHQSHRNRATYVFLGLFSVLEAKKSTTKAQSLCCAIQKVV